MENKNKNQSRNMYLLMLLVPLFWGGAFATAKHVITEVPPLVAATLRFGITGIILVIFITIQKKMAVASNQKSMERFIVYWLYRNFRL